MTELKKTRILSQTSLPEEQCILEVLFISEKLLAMELYESERRKSWIEVRCLDTQTCQAYLQLDLKASSTFAWCAWQNGLAIVTEGGLTFLPVTETSIQQETLEMNACLTDSGLQASTDSSIRFYPLANPNKLKMFYGEETTPYDLNILQIFPLKEDAFVVSVTTPKRRYRARAMMLLKIHKGQIVVLGPYRQLSQDQGVSELVSLGFRQDYITLQELNVCDGRIWCLAEATPFNFNEDPEVNMTLLTSYRYQESSKGFYQRLFTLDSSEHDYFEWEQSHRMIEGPKVFFSENGQYLWRRFDKPKNLLECQNVLTGEVVHQIKLTPAQSLNETPLNRAGVYFFNDKLFLVTNSDKNITQWNLCEVID